MTSPSIATAAGPLRSDGGAERRAGRPSRVGASRETVVALAALPVLLVGGFALGGVVLPGAGTSDAAVAGAAAPAPAPAAPAPASAAAVPAPAAAVPAPADPAPAPAQAAPAAPAPAAAPAPGTAAAPAPAASGVLTRGSSGEPVRQWQARMVERGWVLAVDGRFGPESAAVARRFQAESGLVVDGVVGPRTWAATWETPAS